MPPLAPMPSLEDAIAPLGVEAGLFDVLPVQLWTSGEAKAEPESTLHVPMPPPEDATAPLVVEAALLDVLPVPLWTSAEAVELESTLDAPIIGGPPVPLAVPPDMILPAWPLWAVACWADSGLVIEVLPLTTPPEVAAPLLLVALAALLWTPCGGTAIRPPLPSDTAVKFDVTWFPNMVMAAEWTPSLTVKVPLVLPLASTNETVVLEPNAISARSSLSAGVVKPPSLPAKPVDCSSISSPPLAPKVMVPLATPPADTISVPPFRVVPASTPPEKTNSKLPLPTVVPTAVPLMIFSVPPLETDTPSTV